MFKVFNEGGWMLSIGDYFDTWWVSSFRPKVIF